MFRRMTFHFSGPICSCDKQDISWGIWKDEKGNHGIKFTCKLCRTELVIPHAKFIGRFDFEQPYPADAPKAEPDENTRLRLLTDEEGE